MVHNPYLSTDAVELITKQTKDTMAVADQNVTDIRLLKTMNNTAGDS